MTDCWSREWKIWNPLSAVIYLQFTLSYIFTSAHFHSLLNASSLLTSWSLGRESAGARRLFRLNELLQYNVIKVACNNMMLEKKKILSGLSRSYLYIYACYIFRYYICWLYMYIWLWGIMVFTVWVSVGIGWFHWAICPTNKRNHLLTTRHFPTHVSHLGTMKKVNTLTLTWGVQCSCRAWSICFSCFCI